MNNENNNGTSVKAEKAEKMPKKKLSTRAKRRLKKIFALVVVLAVVTVSAIKVIPSLIAGGTEEAATYTLETAARRDITNVLSASGTINAVNTYTITSLASGEIISAEFEVGDTVEEGQLLYRLSTDDAEEDIASAEKNVERANRTYENAVKSVEKAEAKLVSANEDYQDAIEDYNEAVADYDEAEGEYQELVKETYSSINLKSEYTGTVTKTYVETGDEIKEGEQIADIVNDKMMILTVPFNFSDISQKLIGKKAEINVSGSLETIAGTVTEADAAPTVLSGNRLVGYVAIEVKNPGGITAGSTATADIGDISCNEAGTFEYSVSTTITSQIQGTIDEVFVKKGSIITENSVLISYTDESVDDFLDDKASARDQAKSQMESALNKVEQAESSIESAKDSIESASDSVDTAKDNVVDAEDNLETAKDGLEDCDILSPVTGRVVTKNFLEGETIDTSNFNSTLATIYDLSAVTFEMSVDESDVLLVEVGQTVNVTADAMERSFEGVVTNVSLVSSYGGGVTQYPITVQIDDIGNLLPGMNVTGEIVVEEALDVIAISSSALQRGNVVYVKDDDSTATVTGTASGDGTDSAAGKAAETGSEVEATDNPSVEGSDETKREIPERTSDGTWPEMTDGATNGEMPDGSFSVNTASMASEAPEGFHAVIVETGISDDKYIEIMSGISEGDQIYIAAITYGTGQEAEEEGLFDFGNMTGESQSGSSRRFQGGMQGGMPGGMQNR